MGSTFSGISSALTALQVQRKAMEVVGQNVANANTAGYTRQRVDTQALVAAGSTMVSATARDVGDGVQVTSVSRLNDPFVDARVRSQTATSAESSARAATLSSLEDLTKEPTDKGLAASLDDMWSSWQDLANTVGSNSDGATREVVLTKTSTVIAALATAHGSIETAWDTEHAQDAARLTDVNSTAASVADLNTRITLATASGGDANDMVDQRDQLVLHLSQVAGATASQGGDGTYNVYLGGVALVAGDRASTVQLKPGGATRLADAGTSPVGLQVVTAGRATDVVGVGGELGASLTALNTTLPGASSAYDGIASALATSVNALQVGGYTADGSHGSPLFATKDGSSAFTASNLALGLTAGAGLAAGAGGGAADGRNADAVAQLATAAGGPNALWKAYVGRLGTDAAAAATRSTTAASALQSATADQQSASGVSIDEEATNLLVLQRAYQGAARVMTAVDEALDTLINKTGLVGR